MDSIVIDQEPSLAGQIAHVARDHSDTILGNIRGHAILGLLPERDLLTLVQRSSIRSLPKNRLLFRIGDEGRSVALVLHGYVKLSSIAPNGREVVLEIAGPGSIFGELAVINGSPRQADATTLTSCRVMAIDGGLFRRSLAAAPEAMFAAMRLLSERLSATTAREMDAISLPAPVRLAKALLYLAEQHSCRVNNGVQLCFRLSQRELGAMTGLIRESINKHLKAWRASGWIELSNGNLTLRDLRALQEYVRDNGTP